MEHSWFGVPKQVRDLADGELGVVEIAPAAAFRTSSSSAQTCETPIHNCLRYPVDG